MNIQKSGFSLFSFCIYLGLVVMLVSTVLPIFFHVSTNMMHIAQKQRIVLELSRTMTLMTRILSHVDPEKVTHYNSCMLVWEQQEGHQGIFFDDKKHTLYFVEGIFDTIKKIWKKKKKTLLSYHVIPTFSFVKTPFPRFDIILSCKEQSVSYRVIPIIRAYALHQESTL